MKRLVTKFELNKAVNNASNCKNYLDFVIECNRLDVYEYITKRDKIGKKLTPETFIESSKELVSIWNDTDMKNQIYDKKFMGLKVHESISAVAVPIAQIFKTIIPKLENYIKSI